MNKIRILVLIVAVFFSFQAFAQKRDVVILWDVTESMRGGSANTIEEDIWDQTKKQIIAQINNMIENGISTVHILPFQNPFDNPMGLKWEEVENIDKKKKQQLIKWVTDFDVDPTKARSTNLCGALQKAFEKINSFSGNYDEIILALYSDGKQSEPYELHGGHNFDASTCFDDKVRKFCSDFCPPSSENRFYILKLKDYDSNIETECECIDESDSFKDALSFRLKPSISRKELLYADVVGSHPIKFTKVFGIQPKDLKVTASSTNPNITIASDVSVEPDGNFVIKILSASVSEGNSESAKIEFKGTSNDDSIRITIEPLDILVINKKMSKVIIGGINKGAIKN